MNRTRSQVHPRMTFIRPIFLIALCTQAFAADFTTGKISDAAALLPTPRDEVFLTPQGKPE